jgi:nucleotide-binding universal stress UspA family protein
MKTIHKIMVAVDFSEYSQASVNYAVILARDIGAEVLLVHVYNQRDIDTFRRIEAEYPKFSFARYYKDNLQDRQNRLEKLEQESKSIAPDVKVASLVVVGVPHEALLKAIAVKKPDMLVVGIKGRSNLMDTIVGTCARKLFRYSPIPVLSVRQKIELRA